MSYEVVQKIGKHQYIYLAKGYRNVDGKPRQKRIPIGKIDPKTGEKIYKQSYIESCKAEGKELPPVAAKEPRYSIDDIRESTVKSYGLTYFLQKVAEKVGLTEVLESALPFRWPETLALAMFVVASGEPLSSFNDWLSRHDLPIVSDMSPERIVDLTQELSLPERRQFYALWGQSRNDEETEYLAFDIAFESAYSELVDEAERGADQEKLPQINLSMLFGESRKLPIGQEMFDGGLRDVSSRRKTLAKFRAISGEKKIVAVLDKGAYSPKNVAKMLSRPKSEQTGFLLAGFLQAVPFAAAFAKDLVNDARRDIDRLESNLIIDGVSIRATTMVRPWDQDNDLFAHVYFNAKKANDLRESRFGEMTRLKELAETEPAKYRTRRAFTRYLSFEKSEKLPGGWSVSFQKDVIEKELQAAGWLTLISDSVSDAKKALTICRDKYIVEKSFRRVTNSLEFKRRRTYGEQSRDNEMFLGFVASILMAEIHKVMAEKKLFQKFSMTEMLNLLAGQDVQYLKGDGIIFPLSQAQRDVFDAFGISVPLLL